MRRARQVKAPGSWPAEAAAASVTLAFADRHRRRIRLTDDAGEAFLLDLEEARMLRDGDGLVLEGGGVIRVRAAAEPVADIRCGSAAALARIAWHIGNRHVALQVLEDARACALRIADDHVLRAMVEGLGARVVRRRAPFQPEPGAYAAGAGHDH
jgi:urease accessory protein